MNAMRGFGAAAVFESATPAGIIADNKGKATLAPAPRSTVRRLRCFFRINIAWFPYSLLSAARSAGRGNFSLLGFRVLLVTRLRHFRHLKRFARHDAEHDRRQA